MECLYCGYCCEKMSPFSCGEKIPCHFLILETTKNGHFYFCNDYENRPEECKKHEFSFVRFCPIGVDTLKLSSIDTIHQRIEIGRDMIVEIIEKEDITC